MATREWIMTTTTRNEEIEKALETFVETGKLAGMATLAWRRGRRRVTCVGWRDREARLPVESNTIFRIASMTKPITTVAALMLLEEGRFALDEPIARRWAPEFAEMRVLRTLDAALDDTVPAQRSIAFEDLLTHRSGITYGAWHQPSIAAAFHQALGGDIDSDVRPDAWIAALARLPLIDQPGAALYYGHSTDLLGLLIARMEGTSLGHLLRARLFNPLGMTDTGFIVSPDKWDRRARMYGFDDD